MNFPIRQFLRAVLTRSAATVLLVYPVSAARAQTIHWGNNILDNLIQSDGTPITAAGSFNFEFGVFVPGFTPTSANPENWLASWRPLDAAVFNETARYFSSSFNIIPDPGDPLLGGSDSPEAYSGLQVQEGQQLYMFVYNNTNMDTSTELFLAGAGTWTLPPVSDSQTSMPSNFRLSQVSSPPVFGGANDNRGGGNFSDQPPVFTMQTATFIPEPGTGFMVLAAASVLFTGRRRRLP